MNMTPLSRKQREIRDRELLILDNAAELLYQEGYAGLSMERIAEAIEYSKGTVYQHFKCKEEVLCALCIRSMNVQLSMFTKATHFNGRPREKMVAVLIAHHIFVQLFPREFANLQVIKASLIRDKVSPEGQKNLRQCEDGCLSSIAAIIHEAQQQGDLTLNDMSPTELIFGLWSLAYGGSILMGSDIPLADLGIVKPEATINQHCYRLLDAFDWQPLTADWDYKETCERIRGELFTNELQLLKQTL